MLETDTTPHETVAVPNPITNPRQYMLYMMYRIQGVLNGKPFDSIRPHIRSDTTFVGSQQDEE